MNRRVGDYELGPELGRGGLGTVVQARHLPSGTEVALKLIKFGIDHPAARQRFETECRVLTRLEHPHIVRVHEVGFDGGRPFLALQLVQGRSLDQRLKAGPLPISQAVALTRQVAAALQHAHDRKVLHRDVKPGNVLIDAEGRALLTDFGLAKDLEASLSLTRTGQLSGTPGFQAPEQAKGDVHQQGPATDVYGLGALFYALLTGRPPFQRASAVETMTAVVEDPAPAPSALRPGLDAALDAIALRCLAKAPAARYDAPRDVDAALARWEQAARAPRRSPSKAVAALVGLGLVAAAGVLVLRAPASRAGPPAGPEEVSLEPTASLSPTEATPEPKDRPAPQATPDPQATPEPADRPAPDAPPATLADYGGESALQLRADAQLAVVVDRHGYVWSFGLPGVRPNVEGLQGCDGPPGSVALAGLDPWLALFDAHGKLQLRGLQRDRRSATLVTRPGPSALAWCPNDRWLLLHHDGETAVYDVEARALVAHRRPPSQPTVAMAGSRASDDGQAVFASLGADGMVDRWRLTVATKRLSLMRMGNHEGAHRVAIGPRGDLLASAAPDGGFAVYDGSGEEARILCGELLAHGPVLALRFTTWGTLLVLCERALVETHARSGTPLRKVPLVPPARLAAVDPRSRTVVWVGDDGQLRDVDARSPGEQRWAAAESAGSEAYEPALAWARDLARLGLAERARQVLVRTLQLVEARGQLQQAAVTGHDLGRTLLALGQAEEAAATLERAFELAFLPAYAHDLLQSYLRRGRLEAAEARGAWFMEQVEANGRQPKAARPCHLYLAKLALARGDLVQALAQARLARSPANGTGELALEVSLVEARAMALRGQVDEAVDLLRVAVAGDTAAAIHPSLVARQAVVRIHALLLLGDFKRAGATTGDAISAMPGDPDVLAAAAQVALVNRKPRSVLDFSRRALAINPEQHDARCARATALLEQGDVDGALRTSSEVLELTQARWVPALLLRAQVYVERGDLDAAERDLAAALALEPTSRDAVLVRGLIEVARGDTEAARASLASIFPRSFPGGPVPRPLRELRDRLE